MSLLGARCAAGLVAWYVKRSSFWEESRFYNGSDYFFRGEYGLECRLFPVCTVHIPLQDGKGRGDPVISSVPMWVFFFPLLIRGSLLADLS